MTTLHPPSHKREAAAADRPAGDATYLYCARALRDFGDGFVAVLLPVYLTAIGLGPIEVGVVATFALLGSALMTLGIGLMGARLDQRHLLIAASGLMVATGILFALSSTYAVILIIALAGTINPSAGSVEHLRPARACPAGPRGAGCEPHGHLRALQPDRRARCRGWLARRRQPRARCQVRRRPADGAQGHVRSLRAARHRRRHPLRAHPTCARQSTPSRKRRTARSVPRVGIVYKLAALFSIDAFAGGFAVQSLLALWLFERFGLSLATAALFFFWSGVFAAFSFPVAAWLSRRIGLVNTMVYTHIPSSLALILAAVAPSVEVALALLLVRAALSQMDVPTRSSYVMAVVTPPERRGGGELHLGAPQPGGGGKPRARRRHVRCGLPGLAAHHLRRAQDRLRPGPALGLPTRQAARGERSRELERCYGRRRRTAADPVS